MSAFLRWKASFVIEIMETNVRVTCTVTAAKMAVRLCCNSIKGHMRI